MNYKKYLIIITVVLIIGILFTTAYNMEHKKLATDSGFDSDFGGGSSDFDSSWDSSSDGSGGGSMSPETALGLLYVIGVSTAGYGIRRLFRKKKENESMFIDTILGIVFLAPLTVTSGLIVGEYRLDIITLLLIFGGIGLFYFIINTIRNASLGKYVKYEYILLTIILIVLLLISTFILGNSDSLFLLIVLSIVIAPFMFISILIKLITGKGIVDNFINISKEATKDIKQLNSELPKEEIEKLIKDNNLEEDKLYKDAYEIYKRIQLAWMNDTIDDVNDCLSDEMANMYKAQLLTLRRKNEQNVMSDFEYVSGQIKNIEDINNDLYISIELRVKCKDYLINKESGKVVRGNKNKINNYYYELGFLMNRQHPKNCPNCGYELKKGGGVTCPSCKSKIILNNGNMMMIRKRMISQS